MVETDSDSSSDSNDDVKKFADALYPDFKILPARQIAQETVDLPGRGSNGEASNSKSRNEVTIKTNRRGVKSEDWECGHFVHPLKLTPSNQEFVSKQLSSSLDRQIKETKKSKLDLVADTDDDNGIFLFQTSTKRLRGKDLRRYEKRSQKKVRQVRCKSESDSEDDAKLQCVAVSADWVLNPKTL